MESNGNFDDYKLTYIRFVSCHLFGPVNHGQTWKGWERSGEKGWLQISLKGNDILSGQQFLESDLLEYPGKLYIVGPMRESSKGRLGWSDCVPRPHPSEYTSHYMQQSCLSGLQYTDFATGHCVRWSRSCFFFFFFPQKNWKITPQKLFSCWPHLCL